MIVRDIEVDVEKLAYALNVAPRTIQRYAESGKVAKVGKNKYNLFESIRRYTDYLRSDTYFDADKVDLRKEQELTDLEIAKEVKHYMESDVKEGRPL